MSTTEISSPPAPTIERHTPPAAPASSVVREPFITLEQLAYIGLAILSVVVHMWALGDRAMHHDETLHAYYSWRLYVGQGYMHDPLMHGPFLYYFTALMYFLFGDNDFTARLGVALFGSVLVLLPYLIRRDIGRTAALTASIYLLISPAFLYMGRMFRHDMFSLVFEMLVFVAIVRYANTRSAHWLYVGVAAFALMYANQETSYLFLLMLGTPLVALLLWRVFKPGLALLGGLGVALVLLVFVLPGEAQVNASHEAERQVPNDLSSPMVVAEPGPIFGWGPLETEDNNYALRVRHRADTMNDEGLLHNFVVYLGDVGRFLSHPAILLGITLLLATSGLLVWLIWLRPDKTGLTPWQRALADGDPALPAYGSLAHGRRWLIALGIFFIIYALLFTSFFANIIGLVSGTTGSLLYWLAQHNVERGSQPPYYYLVLLVLYEPLLALWSTVGLGLVIGQVVTAVRRHRQHQKSSETPPPPPFTRLLLPLLLAWWSITALGIYSWAGEKMPWLVVHIALPMVLLSAWAFQRVLQLTFGDRPFSELRGPLALFGSIFALFVGLGYIQMTRYVSSGVEPGSAISAFTLLAMIGVLMGLLVLATSLLWNWRLTLGALALCLTLTGVLYTVRSSYRVNYELPDVPREMLIYTQTTPDMMRVVRDLETISQLRTRGLEMPIIYDNETIWQWYLRDFTNAQSTGQNLSGPPDSSVQAVLLLEENYARNPEIRDYLADFRIQKYPLRWWFPQHSVYALPPDWQTTNLDNASLLTRMLREPFADATLVNVWDFVVHRDPGAPLGSTNVIVAVRPDIATLMTPGIGADQ